MIAGEVLVFKGNSDEPEVQNNALIELTEWGKEIEIVLNAGQRRVYVKFRLEDLIREVKEARKAP